MITLVEKQDLEEQRSEYKTLLARQDVRLTGLTERVERLEAEIVEQEMRAERVIFAPVELIGPVPGDGIVVPGSGPEWQFLTAVTANTALFDFSLNGFATAATARWVLVWIPGPLTSGATAARLVAWTFDDNNKRIELELAQIAPQGNTNPVPQAVYFTDKLNELIRAGKYQHIGCQFKDTGPWRIYESCLEIHWRV